MDPRAVQPSCSLFVVLEGLATRLGDLCAALEPLTRAAAEGPFLLGVDIYYRADTDVALLAVNFDERSMTEAKRRWIVALAGDSGLPVLDPARLGDDDRDTFFGTYLGNYGVRIENSDGPGPALEELARLLGVDAPSIARSIARDRAAGRTEPNQNPRAALRSSRLSAGSTARRVANDSGVRRPSGRGSAPEYVAEDYHTDRVLVDLDDSMARKLPARGKQRAHGDRSRTVPERPFARASSPADELVHFDPNSSAPSRRVAGEGTGCREVQVRFQRGDHWSLGRLRTLSPRAAVLATGAPPPDGTTVRVSITFADHGVTLEGVVAESKVDADAAGSNGFRVDFIAVDAAARAQLIDLLKAAKGSGVSLVPPPPRKAARFPVSWPVTVSTSNGPVQASVLDVSTCGLFVATESFIRDPEMRFFLPLDRGGLAVEGRARVAREVSEIMARSRGLERGYGVEIVALDASDGRYDAFLERVRLRSERHVVIAAAPGRLEPLVDGLAAAGYAVTAATRASDLTARGFESRAPDAAVLDYSLNIDRHNRVELQEHFSRHRVPCVTTRGEPPHSARAAIDRLLSVGLV